ncbi:hypothetical protein LX83_003320 [Goodfellowiella coeruleoviolacea]|uniref:Uncharacterized protein n=1 Tax=Goodfellowiella coeruleoviolacea TaxID=334858 RepID=A0AAE3GFJ6_9PSEU|nr:hypothetical protein [Goodfellowiella coeruleoviolacea]
MFCSNLFRQNNLSQNSIVVFLLSQRNHLTQRSLKRNHSPNTWGYIHSSGP